MTRSGAATIPARPNSRAHPLLPLLGACTIAAMLALLPLLAGCRPKVPSADEIRHIFPEDPLPENTPASAGLDIYIDGSGSMQGFVATRDSVFRQTLGDLLLSASQNRFDLKVYQFSSTIQPVTGQILTAVQNTGFYTGADTPLASLLTQIMTHRDRTAIVVSDLVLSSHSEDSPKLVQSLATLAAQRPQIKLLGLRSAFNGRYTSERSGQKYTLALSQSAESTGRPFYMLVVAPSAAAMEKAQKDLLNHVQAYAETFDATSRAFTVQGASLTTDRTRTEWIPVSRYTVRDQPSNRFETAFRLARPHPEDTAVTLPVTLTYTANVPLTRAGELSLDGQMASFANGIAARAAGWAFSPVNKVKVPLAGDLSQKDGKSLMHLVLTLSPPGRDAWDVYRIRLRPGDNNLDLPEWTKRWSTDDDSTPANGNQTYLLRLLVGTMENTVTQEQVCGDWILKVGGKE